MPDGTGTTANEIEPAYVWCRVVADNENKINVDKIDFVTTYTRDIENGISAWGKGIQGR
jgi:hypothetical protein